MGGSLRCLAALGVGIMGAMTVASPAATAQSSDDISTMSQWNGTSYVTAFGVPNTATYGQTFTAPADGAPLTGFSFDLHVPATTTFRAYVYAWSGSKASGQALYISPVMSTSGSGAQVVAVSTGAVPLTAGAQYVLFFSTSGVVGSASTGGWADEGNTYPGGNFVYINNGSNASEWTTGVWDQWTGTDLAFTATFQPYAKPAISVGDATVVAGAGTTKVQVPVTLSSPQSGPVTVQVATSDDTAVAYRDYRPINRTLTIPAGVVSATFVVPITKSSAHKNQSRTFNVTLSDATGINLGWTQGTVDIEEDPANTGLSVSDVTLLDCDAGRPVAVTNVELASPQATPVTVEWTTAGVRNFKPTTGTLTIPAGATYGTIRTVIRDNVKKTNQFQIVLSNPTGTTIDNGTGTVTILPD